MEVEVDDPIGPPYFSLFNENLPSLARLFFSSLLPPMCTSARACAIWLVYEIIYNYKIKEFLCNVMHAYIKYM